MRPRRCFLSLLLLLCSLPLLAQEYKLSGRVTGGEGEAVVGARVTLSHEGQILAFAFTRKGGRFALTSDRSYPRMTLSLSHLSYETDSISLTPDRHEVTLRLSPRVSQLQEVTVEAYPMQDGMDPSLEHTDETDEEEDDAPDVNEVVRGHQEQSS